ncbi:cell division protein FtsZ [Tenacibaculum maritimum]|uniref:cell division protein FtsZ n=1 Tax=Tenacibaculum maritimum TaxID=107401 RepID=UPI0012E4BB0E|nr:cell division protein FtsZ [Tenacibaculum maritimum]MCD9563717.1 cell division protein FtsZ [Tenacibaculum maritimum]MCD9566337.1 cell division protein FtsZ [Tenacibaculum maritimum]MCD9579698.1 cell division protein FtsZ [Tenacibaculum maritimum]MCD9596882.1 cell division protein FtsZ [Tenacibaculum maritimum]MCD9614080.1 cell division protein FtsZ [Tenacibaculum maritimum]
MGAEFDNISFDMPKTQSNAIKVIGVGGGGSNAVNHMFQQNIKGVDFVICNTDSQALENSAIPNKIQLGVNLTSGLGAGANPEVGAQAANESMQEIQQMLNTQTKMVFITAGMGGGTGTGAAPIIAKIAKDMDILTVGIVTMPFQFEGRMRSKQAQLGIDTLRKNVDSLIVINNNKLREVYGNLGFKAGFSKADEVLSTAAKGIAEVITHHYKQNIDLHDAKTVLSNSGTAIMGSAKETGTNRAKNAIVKALDSPLLNDNKITGAKNVLLLIVSGTSEVTLDEIGEINDYIQTEAGYDANIIMGIGEDEALEDGIAVTVVATGFAADQQNTITNTEVKKIVHTLEDEQKATYDFSEKKISKTPTINEPLAPKVAQKIVHVLEDEVEERKERIIPTTDFIKNLTVSYDEIATENIQEEDFIITNITSSIEEETPKTDLSSRNPDSLFDLPLDSYDEVQPERTLFDLNNDVETNTPKEIPPKREEVVERRYVLEDFDVKPTIGKSSTPIKGNPKTDDESLQFQVRNRTQEEINEINTTSEEVSPLSLTISELQKRAEERREKMKGFNYKFADQVSKNIDEIERQPAYKRLGVDLDTDREISKTKTSLKKNDNDDIQLRSNNSFLHDNVD